MCGPDIIYKCKSKNTIYFVQVKFLKGISKQEAVKACDTVNKELFYCKRNDKNGSKNTVLKGFEEKRNLLLESIDELQKDGYSLQPILFVHSEKPMSSNMREAMIVTRNSNPDFFNSLGCEASGIWNLLDSARSNF